MATRYSVNLYFPIESIEKALIATADVAQIENRISSQLILSNGRKIIVPFDEMLFLAPMDEFVQAYYEQQKADIQAPAIDRDGITVFPVGYVDLTISIGQSYAEFSYGVRSSQQNELFAKSTAIHHQFLHILNSANGLVAVLDNEHKQFFDLRDFNKQFEMVETLYHDDVNPDQWVEAMLQKLT